jgi:hypothetical protein
MTANRDLLRRAAKQLEDWRQQRDDTMLLREGFAKFLEVLAGAPRKRNRNGLGHRQQIAARDEGANSPRTGAKVFPFQRWNATIPSHTFLDLAHRLGQSVTIEPPSKRAAATHRSLKTR